MVPEFGLEYGRRRLGRQGDTWYLDELLVRIQGRTQYLWRAVDEDGDVIDILVQPRGRPDPALSGSPERMAPETSRRRVSVSVKRTVQKETGRPVKASTSSRASLR